MTRSLLFLLALILSSTISAQAILLDEDTSDWTTDIVTYEDFQDNNSLDIRSLAIADDANAFYLKIELDKAIILQNQRDITLTLEHQNTELNFNFGDRKGSFKNGFTSDIYHSDIGLIISPTVTSKVFEIKIDKSWIISGSNYELDGTIELSIRNAESGGDQLPNNNQRLSYTLSDNTIPHIPDYNLEKAAGNDFRFCSYNVLFDKIFESGAQTEYTAILASIDADIFAFQEIYDHTATQLQNRLDNDLGVLDNSYTWYSSKQGLDNIVVSRYPIVYGRGIAGNGVFVLEVDDTELLLINVHLPCCAKNDEREDEIDAILEFIRKAKDGSGDYKLKENSPIIIAGDANFVGNANQVEAFVSGNLFNNNASGPDFNLDWDDDGLQVLKTFATGSNSLYTYYNEFGSYSKGRLDYAFFSDHALTALNTFVLDTDGLSEDELRQYNLQPNYSTEASDHYPIVVDFRHNTSVATAELSAEDIAVWPMPTSGPVKIEHNLGSDTHLDVFSPNGHLILQSKGDEIDLTSFPAGLYLLKFRNSDGRSTIKKLIKQ